MSGGDWQSQVQILTPATWTLFLRRYQNVGMGSQGYYCMYDSGRYVGVGEATRCWVKCEGRTAQRGVAVGADEAVQLRFPGQSACPCKVCDALVCTPYLRRQRSGACALLRIPLHRQSPVESLAQNRAAYRSTEGQALRGAAVVILPSESLLRRHG